MIMEILVICAVALSCFSAGFLFPAYLELKRARQDISAKVKEFEEITREASKANVSLADKILQLEEKISTLEFWKANNLYTKK